MKLRVLLVYQIFSFFLLFDNVTNNEKNCFKNIFDKYTNCCCMNKYPHPNDSMRGLVVKSLCSETGIF